MLTTSNPCRPHAELEFLGKSFIFVRQSDLEAAFEAGPALSFSVLAYWLFKFCPDVRVGMSRLGRSDFQSLQTTFPMN